MELAIKLRKSQQSGSLGNPMDSTLLLWYLGILDPLKLVTWMYTDFCLTVSSRPSELYMVYNLTSSVLDLLLLPFIHSLTHSSTHQPLACSTCRVSEVAGVHGTEQTCSACWQCVNGASHSRLVQSCNPGTICMHNAQYILMNTRGLSSRWYCWEQHNSNVMSP